jgi:hypothetical protein
MPRTMNLGLRREKAIYTILTNCCERLHENSINYLTFQTFQTLYHRISEQSAKEAQPKPNINFISSPMISAVDHSEPEEESLNGRMAKKNAKQEGQPTPKQGYSMKIKTSMFPQQMPAVPQPQKWEFEKETNGISSLD